MSGGWTPGPWRLDEIDPGTFEVLGPTKGFCADIIVSGYFWNPNDARLIAAAPELVEALRAIQKTMDGYRSQAKFCDIEALGYFREFDRRIEASGFRALLTKFEGDA